MYLLTQETSHLLVLITGKSRTQGGTPIARKPQNLQFTWFKLYGNFLVQVMNKNRWTMCISKESKKWKNKMGIWNLTGNPLARDLFFIVLCWLRCSVCSLWRFLTADVTPLSSCHTFFWNTVHKQGSLFGFIISSNINFSAYIVCGMSKKHTSTVHMVKQGLVAHELVRMWTGLIFFHLVCFSSLNKCSNECPGL